MSQTRHVHLIDDEEAIRHSVGFTLRQAGFSVQAYESAAAFLHGLPTALPGCVLLDVRIPQMDGLELQQLLVDGGETMPIVVMSGHGDVATAIKAMKAGAVDFIEKPFVRATLIAAVDKALALFDRRISRAEDIRAAAGRVATLSGREREVLQGLARGLPNKTIAAELGISTRTVEVHRARLIERLDAQNFADLLRIAFDAAGRKS